MSDRAKTNFTINAAFFQEIKDDHLQLRSLLDQVCKLVENRGALGNHKRELVQLLADLRDQLAFHFALEEAYGYFEDAIGMAPWIHDKAGMLRDQHAELYTMSEQLAEIAEDRLGAKPPDITTVVLRFEAFHAALKAHESAELGLIMDAITQDVGAGD